MATSDTWYSRRHFVGDTLGSAMAVFASLGRESLEGVAAQSAEVEVRLLPGRVFRRTSDANRERLEHAHCVVGLLSRTVRSVVVERLVVSHWSGVGSRLVQTYDRAALATMNLMPPTAPDPAAAPPFRLFAMQLRTTYPQAFGVERIECEFRLRAPGQTPLLLRKVIPLETYAAANTFIFPFRGVGLISQGGIANDGHRNRSGLFAIDALALTDSYGIMRGTGDAPDALAGWGRPIIAPAAGTIVRARGDRPDQPVVGNSDPTYYVPEHPQGGDPGNHVVIEHAGSEFSMIAHLQAGSLLVKPGDRVTQGQPLGALGNSGDSNSPHLHHQVQSGPDWMLADGYPHHYENGPGRNHDRGALFNARG